jgi:hypothetical protein
VLRRLSLPGETEFIPITGIISSFMDFFAGGRQFRGGDENNATVPAPDEAAKFGEHLTRSSRNSSLTVSAVQIEYPYIFVNFNEKKLIKILWQ